MIPIAWRGPAPQPAWVAELQRAGIVIGSPRTEAKPALTVLRTSGKEVPLPPDRGAWLWLPTVAPGVERMRQAVLAGALDVVAADDAALVTKLVARTTEANVPEPTLPQSLGFVAHSETAQ